MNQAKYSKQKFIPFKKNKYKIYFLGQKGVWINKKESFNYPEPVEKYKVNHDLNPEIIRKYN